MDVFPSKPKIATKLAVVIGLFYTDTYTRKDHNYDFQGYRPSTKFLFCHKK